MTIRSQLKRTAFNTSSTLLNPLFPTDTGEAQPILIAGNPRSGTTWIGNTFALAPNALYYHEPGGPAIDADFAERTRDFQPDPSSSQDWMRARWDPVVAGKIVEGCQWWHRPMRLRKRLAKTGVIAFKEVSSLSCLPWFVNAYSCQIVLVIRHPCAVALSYQGYDWTLWPQSVIKQRGSLHPFSPKLVRLMDQADTHWERCGAAWAARHEVLASMLSENPNWCCVIYEDVCLRPDAIFRQLNDRLGLQWTDRVSDLIARASTASGRESDRTNSMHTFRDSRKQIDRWRNKLSAEQIEQVKRFVLPFNLPWYSKDEDW